jgi:hypothetical protein
VRVRDKVKEKGRIRVARSQFARRKRGEKKEKEEERRKRRKGERGGKGKEEERGKIVGKYPEERNKLLWANECKFSETLCDHVSCSLFLALAIFEQQSEDGGEVWLEDGASCACRSLSHDYLRRKRKKKERKKEEKMGRVNTR